MPPKRGRPPGSRFCDGDLTRREQAVVAAILSGKTTYHEIAVEMKLSWRTVQTHLANIYAKTRARNMTDVVLMAIDFMDCPVKNMPKIKRVFVDV